MGLQSHVIPGFVPATQLAFFFFGLQKPPMVGDPLPVFGQKREQIVR